MGKKLTSNVHVGGRFFEAGSTPPKEFADQITNPNAWAVDDDTSVEATPAPRKTAAARKSAASGK